MDPSQTPSCPTCGTHGTKVATVTVRAMALEEEQARVGDTEYHLCTTPDCETAYYSVDRALTLSVEQIKAPLHFKTSAHKRYVCYCNKITEEDVRSAVQNHGQTKMQAIIRSLRGEAQSDCVHKNPFGRCCTERFHHVIDAAIKNHEIQEG